MHISTQTPQVRFHAKIFLAMLIFDDGEACCMCLMQNSGTLSLGCNLKAKLQIRGNKMAVKGIHDTAQ